MEKITNMFFVFLLITTSAGIADASIKASPNPISNYLLSLTGDTKLIKTDQYGTPATDPNFYVGVPAYTVVTVDNVQPTQQYGNLCDPRQNTYTIRLMDKTLNEWGKVSVTIGGCPGTVNLIIPVIPQAAGMTELGVEQSTYSFRIDSKIYSILPVQNTPAVTSTSTPTPAVTSTPTPTPAVTPTSTPTPAVTPTSTPTPAVTPTSTPTNVVKQKPITTNANIIASITAWVKSLFTWLPW